jgi:hypothetical protein
MAAAEAGPALPVTGLPMPEMAAETISVAVSVPMSVPMAKTVEGKMMVVVVVAVMVVEMMKVVRVVLAEEVAAAETVSARTMRRGVDLSEDEAENARSNNGADFTRKHRSPCRARARPILSIRQRTNTMAVARKRSG